MATVTDSATGIKTTYYYDFTDRLAKYTETGANYSHSVDYTFDEKNNLTAHSETINGTTRTASFVYDDDNRIESMTADGTTVIYTRDAYGRLSQKVTKQGEATVKTETFTYTPNAAATSGQVQSHVITYGTYTYTYNYTYDDNGNILSVTETSTSSNSSDQTVRSTTYTYDTAGQLILEDSGFGFGCKLWNYDDAGNIIAWGTIDDVVIENIHAYTYGDSDWGDLLTAYNGTTIDYDDIGNPLTYGSRTYTWEHGRELSTLTENGTTWTYTYNADGLRTSRTNGTTTYTYIYDGSQLSRMTVDGHTLDFTYDASGTPLTVKLDGTVYYYATNLQGDVIGIFDRTGNQKAMYSYDAWGVIGTMPTQSAISIYNPLRYRGYVYDPETELYYLQSRYYDPEIGRFINADTFTSTDKGFIGNNMFAYCCNNAVSYIDPYGQAAYIFNEWYALGAGFMSPTSCAGFYNGGSAVGVSSSVPSGVGGGGVPLPIDASHFIAVAKAIDTVSDVVDAFQLLGFAKNYGIHTYKELKKQTYGTGLEVHHIIEVRFLKGKGINTQTAPSVVLTKAEHQNFTNQWRRLIGYGKYDYEV